MISKPRNVRFDNVVPEVCVSSFYDFYYRGKKINLLKSKIVATRESRENSREDHIYIYFYLEEFNIIVYLNVPKKLNIDKEDGSRKFSVDLEQRGCFNSSSPIVLLSFLKEYERDYISVYKRVVHKNSVRSLLKEYEDQANSSYCIYNKSKYTFFKSYSELFEIVKNVLQKPSDNIYNGE